MQLIIHIQYVIWHLNYIARIEFKQWADIFERDNFTYLLRAFHLAILLYLRAANYLGYVLNDYCKTNYSSKIIYSINSPYYANNDLVVGVLDSQFRGPWMKTTGWPHGWLSLWFFWVQSNEYQELLRLRGTKKAVPLY